MYKKLLVPMALNHDISPQMLSIAKLLTSNGGSEIIALHVYETPPASVSTYIDEKLMKDGYEQARLTLDEKLANTEGVKQVLAKGHTYRTIVDYASDNGVDCIVIGSHRPGLSDYLLGSTAARVVRHAPCAVHVYRSS